MAEKDLKPKTNSKTTTKSKPETAVKPAAKSAAKPAATKPAAQKSQATAKSAAKPAAAKAEPVKKAAAPATKPVAKQTAKVTEAPAKPAAKPTAKKSDAPVAATAVKKANPAAKPAPVKQAAPKTTAKAEPATKPAPKAQPAKTEPVKAKPAAAVTVKKEKREKTVKTEKPKAENGGKGGIIAAIKNNKKRSIAIAVLALVLLIALVIAIPVGVAYGANRLPREGNGEFYDVNNYGTVTAVGFSAKTDGKVKRYKPVAEIGDERDLYPLGIEVADDARYPVYGKSMNSVLGSDDAKTNARQQLINESSYLTATGTSTAGGGGYNMIDSEGMLWTVKREGDELVKTPSCYPETYKDGAQRQLYQHVASVGLYGGNVADDEPAVKKTVTIRPRAYTRGYGVTGLYAPAGEVIKIEMSGADMKATGGIVIHIGQALYNGKNNNIWAAKGVMNRMPHVMNTLTISADTATYDEKKDVWTGYVGSFMGGPIYIRNESVTFSATISGGVTYSHFILGYTTEKEFKENAKSSAPYFDLEVWDNGVLHSGPVAYAKNFSYSDIYNVAVLWDKVANVTTTGSTQGIVFLYDPFVAAGAAVAFPGQGSVNCPAGWMSSSLNYNALITSGSWGNFHEYHHNFQGYGVGAGGEVTNNAMTLVSYSLFTKISAKRSTGNYGSAGLGGWNNYTSAPLALEEVLKISDPNADPSNGDRGLALYATLLHNYGPDNFIQAKYRQQSKRYGESYSGYFKAWEDITHNDMTYYFTELLASGKTNTEENPFAATGLSKSEAAALHNSAYTSMFVPVSSVYQTGRSYLYDGEKKYITTMQPYVIPYGQDFTVDLREYVDALTGSIVIPDGFSYSVKEIKQPEHGVIAASGTDKVYTFIPDKNMRSGEIVVTLSVTKDDGAFKVDDIDLVLEFEQTHETTKYTIERTTYTYSSDNPFESAQAAYEANYGNYTDAVSGDNINPINPNNGKVVQNCNAEVWYIDKPENNAVVEIKGKMYAEETAKYRIALRGRWNTALYVSVGDEEHFELAATYVHSDDKYNFPLTEGTYKDYQLNAETWVYFKAVLLVGTKGNTSSFIGVGWGKFTPEMGLYDDEGNIVDFQPESVNVGYTNAYRNSYEANKTEFKTDYLYKRSYRYDYKDNIHANAEQTLVSTNYAAGNSWNYANYPVENLADGDKNTFIHTKNGVGASAEKPLEVLLDMGDAKSVNRITFYTMYRPNGDYHAPKNFNLYGSLDGKEFFTVGEFTNVPRVGTTVTADFEEKTFRYCKIVITGSHASLMIIGEIELWRAFEVNGGTQYSTENEMFTYKGKWSGVQTASTFGHARIGASGAKMIFEFTGTRLALLSSNAYDAKFSVYIDGKKVESVQVKADDSPFGVSYLSGKLEKGTHKVEVRLSGKSTVDSVVTFDEAE